MENFSSPTISQPVQTPFTDASAAASKSADYFSVADASAEARDRSADARRCVERRSNASRVTPRA